MRYKKININTKNNYISFMSPTLKNKNNHTRQMTKSIKNINQDELTTILRDLDDLLNNFEKYISDYKSFINSTKKYHEKAIEWAFEKTAIISEYNQKSVINSIEKIIPTIDSNNNYIYPANLFVGASGSGKTTFIKQLIGSINTSFPATMQYNTTIGSMIAIIENHSQELTATAKLINKSDLKNRLEHSYIQIIKEILIGKKQIIDILYENITIFDDKKVKLNYIISKDDFINTHIILLLQEESISVWNEFLKNHKNYNFTIYKNFHENNSCDFFISFDEYIHDKISENNTIIDDILDIITLKIKKIIFDMYKYLKEKKDINVKIEIVDKKDIILLDEKTDFQYPKIITLHLSNINEHTPKYNTKNIFFKGLEYFSSANENKKEKTIFPLIEHLRIKGNFKPLWYNSNISKNYIFNENYIIIDSEGVGHDISNQSVSMEIRNIMSKSKIITVMQNASTQMEISFSKTIKTLIYNGWINKSKFCFNRLEAFDINGNYTTDSKLDLIKSNIKNILKDISNKEQQKIIFSREIIYEDLIIEKSYYFEYLNQIFEIDEKNNYFFVPLEKRSSWEKIKNLNDKNLENILKYEYIKYFTDEKVDFIYNINKYLQEFIYTKDIFSIEDLKFKNLNPIYRADKFTYVLQNINKLFLKEFINNLNNCPWQTIKAFNNRIAGNWSYREWRELKPESLLIDIINKNISEYLLNPENINDINKLNNREFIIIIDEFKQYITTDINELVERIIYFELLENCWKTGNEMKGEGTTYKRKKLIEDKLNEKFIVDYTKQQYNFIYMDMLAIVFKNDFMKSLKYTYI